MERLNFDADYMQTLCPNQRQGEKGACDGTVPLEVQKAAEVATTAAKRKAEEIPA